MRNAQLVNCNQMAGFMLRVRIGTAYDIPGCVSQPGIAPRRGIVRRGGGTFFIINAAETSPFYTISYEKCLEIC